MNYYIRLDDACERRDLAAWDRMEALLDRFSLRPLVGIIPHCEDPMMDRYEPDPAFWDRARSWAEKGWAIALHGYNHVCTTECGGLNPVHARSEFAGLPLGEQEEKIRRGLEILHNHGIEARYFFAPSHTFDAATLEALKSCSGIRMVSDTVAARPYCRDGMTIIPQQSGAVRPLPFPVVTFCYHPNIMEERDFQRLEAFLETYRDRFQDFAFEETRRRRSLYDELLQGLYFAKGKIRKQHEEAL